MPKKTRQANISIQGDKQHLTLTIKGQLDIHSTAIVWASCFEQIDKYQPNKLTIDTQALKYCDSAGINLLISLQKHQYAAKKGCQIVNLEPKLKKILTTLSKTTNPKKQYSNNNHWLIRLGKATYNITQRVNENISFTGEVIYYLAKTLCNPKKMRWQDTWRLLETTGPNALPIVALIGFLIGMIMAFQGVIALEKFGAKLYVPNFVGITLLRELAPLLTAIMVIGRSASAFAAELGSMQLNQEVDALHTMGIDVTPFLVIPRVFASMIMLPLLTIFMIIFGLIGCGVVSHMLGISVPLYLTQLSSALTMQDFLGGMFKAWVFGIVIASIGCMHGLRTKGGAIGVGNSTTQTVVSGIIMIAVLDGLFSIVFYVLNL